jgi:hypothetical protein
MKAIFPRNLSHAGRLVRGVAAAGLLIGAAFALQTSTWLGLGLAAAGLFVLFEALRGWCVLRACGIKTRL